MVKAVFFDFYKTLVYFWPALEDIQEASCKELGLNVNKKKVKRGYALADEFMSKENASLPLANRPPEERDAFFAEYERLVLKGAGVDVTLRLASQVWSMAILVPKQFAPFDDAVPALKLLKERGITVGVISNLRQDMGKLCDDLGLSPHLDFCMTSEEAGAEKPHPPIFLAALERAGVSASEAVHVGDQYQSDVEGARAVGITPVLLDRDHLYKNINDCPRIGGLPELDRLIDRGL